MSFLSSFCSQFLCAVSGVPVVPREIIPVRGLRTWEGSPDFLASFRFAFSKRTWCGYPVTRPHLWIHLASQRGHKTVLFQNVLSSQPDRVEQGVVIEIPSTAVLPTDVLCAQMTNESNELLKFAKWFISTSSSWVKILGIPKKPRGGKGTTHPNASSDVQSTNQLPSDHGPIMMKHYENTLQTFVDCRKIAQRHTLRYIAKHCLDARCLWTCSTNMCQSLSLCLYDVGVARCLQHLPNESQVTLLFGAVLHDFLLTSPYI